MEGRMSMRNFLHGKMRVETRIETGEWVYLGKCGIRRLGGGYYVKIPEKVYRLTSTGIFRLRPDRLFCLGHQGEALAVEVAGRKYVAAVQLEIAIDGKIC